MLFPFETSQLRRAGSDRGATRCRKQFQPPRNGSPESGSEDRTAHLQSGDWVLKLLLADGQASEGMKCALGRPEHIAVANLSRAPAIGIARGG